VAGDNLAPTLGSDGGGAFYAIYDASTFNVAAYSSYIADRHLGGANYLFCDGHVKFFSVAQFKAQAGLFTQSCTD
jgi:prepilin-type processing-associated H-X9-DG protein